jgi:DNA-binding NarL/FixJ family response regulator
MTTAPTRVLLADDHETVRDGLRALFEQVPGIEIVGSVADGSDAVDFSLATPPDVVVMDISMPSSGLDAARRVRALAPGTLVLVLSRHRDSALVREAFSAGASGYVLKQSSFRVLTDAIDAVRRGERYVDPRLADLDIASAGNEPTNAQLTEREHEILRNAALGHSNKDLAAEFGISVKTIEVHKSNAMRKLSLGNRGELLRYAVKRGWLRDI